MSDVVARFIRVAVSGAWAWVAIQLANLLGVNFTADQSESIQLAAIVFLTAIVNAGIAWLGRKLPWLELLLGVNAAPVYHKVKE